MCALIDWSAQENASCTVHPCTIALRENAADPARALIRLSEKVNKRQHSRRSPLFGPVMSVVLETSLGDITVDLYTKERPKACFNFLKLCKIKYYNYNLVFEIKKHYTARTGDPTNTGDGGESIYGFDRGKRHRKRYFGAEQLPIIKHDKIGLVSMVNNGKQQHGSQFFITLSDDLSYLDKQGHTVFGRVVEGLEIVEALNNSLIDGKDVPFKDICISHTVILHDPYSDPPYLDRLIRKPSTSRKHTVAPSQNTLSSTMSGIRSRTMPQFATISTPSFGRSLVFG